MTSTVMTSTVMTSTVTPGSARTYERRKI